MIKILVISALLWFTAPAQAATVEGEMSVTIINATDLSIEEAIEFCADNPDAAFCIERIRVDYDEESGEYFEVNEMGVHFE